MDTALIAALAAFITGLAALGGALLGGLTTVGATHLSNTAALKREQEHRDYVRKEAEYEYAKRLFSDFLAAWMEAMATSLVKEPFYPPFLKASNFAVEIQLTFPALEDLMVRLMLLPEGDAEAGLSPSRKEFLREARIELAKINPSTN